MALLIVLWALSWDGAWVSATGAVAIGFAVLVLAFRTPRALRRIVAPGDVSYGIYVYAFPVQQSVAHMWGSGLGPLTMLAIAFPITYALAFASWRLIERPALALKRRFGRSDPPPP
jgi:peptidoglycan/LPS O-acetylase OafA/YrhL